MKPYTYSGFSVRISLIIAASVFVLSLEAQDAKDDHLPQFLFPEYSEGTVRLKDGQEQVVVMNYNTLTEKMIFRQNGKLLEITGLDKVDTITLQNAKFIPVEKAFYEVLVNAPVSLFVQNRSDLRSQGRPAAYGTTSQTIGPTSVSKLYLDQVYNMALPEEYKVAFSPFYWIRKNGTMYRFLTERQFLKIFPEKGKEIKEFIDQNDIDFRDRNDLIMLVKFCNGPLQ